LETNKKSAALREVERLAVKSSEKPMEFAKALAAFHEETRAPRMGAPRLSPGSIDRVLKSTGISRRILYHHLAIGQTLGHLNLKPERLAKIGWRKLAIMAQHVEEGEKKGEKRDALALQALLRAEKCKARELRSKLKNEPPNASPQIIELRLSPSQYEIFEQALLNNGATKPKKRFVGREAALTRALAAIETD
jgi:hypothetical protein